MAPKSKYANHVVKDLIKLFTLVMLIGLFFFLLEILGEKAIDKFFNIESLHVPDFVGLSLKDAIIKSSKDDIILKIMDEKFDSRLPKNHVISQTPAAGKYVKKGRRIFVTISKGFIENKIPDVQGKFLRTAEIIIKNNGYILGRKTFVYSDTFEENQVISQTPLPSGNLAKGKNIDLLVSYGRKINNVIIPDLSMKDIAQVKAILAASRLKLGSVMYKYDPGYTRGVVVSQLPTKGILSKEETEIDIVINDEIRDLSAVPGEESRLKKVDLTFVMPDNPDSTQKQLRIIAIDDIGTREIFSKNCLPRENVNISANGKGNMRILYYVEGIVVESQKF